MVSPRASSPPGQEQPPIRRIRGEYGTDDRERGRASAGGGGRGGYGARGRGSRYNNRDTDRAGPQRYRPNRSNNAEEKDSEGGDRKLGASAPKINLLSDMEIQHLIAQRDRFHGRPQPVKPTVGITNDTEYFRDVPDSGALIRGKEAQKMKEEEGQEDDDDHEISSINAAEAEVAARLRVVASTAGTRYTTRLGTRLLQGRYVELYDQEGHVDRVLDEAREEQVKKNKQKKSKKAAAEDRAYLEELAAAASSSSSSSPADTATANPTTIETTLRTIQDPRGRWRPVDFEPLGSAEIDFLARELVGGQYDAASALSESEAAIAKEKKKGDYKSNSDDSHNNGNGNGNGNGSGNDDKKAAVSEATRQTVLNSTYLPKDVRTFRRTLETVLAGGYAVPVGAEADVIGDKL